MSCTKRDPDILLLAHGELSGWGALALKWHLRRCASCRKRYQEWTQASASLANTLREPGQIPWQPAARHRPPVSAVTRLSLILLGGVLLLFSAITLYFLSIGTRPAVPPSSRSAQQGGCTPNLPSDQCR